ncbi:MAG: hypothetical protein ACRERE_06495 [Candidatus Entotheonellia bacterium]
MPEVLTARARTWCPIRRRRYLALSVAGVSVVLGLVAHAAHLENSPCFVPSRSYVTLSVFLGSLWYAALSRIVTLLEC